MRPEGRMALGNFQKCIFAALRPNRRLRFGVIAFMRPKLEEAGAGPVPALERSRSETPSGVYRRKAWPR